jgi:acyl-coenzyme A thioesterase PaaI-like protein
VTSHPARSIQEQLEDHLCFGCGRANDEGLRIESFYDGVESVCTFEPEPHHAAGPAHILNGGILATVIDCHAVCTAIAAAYHAEGRAVGSTPLIWCATGSLQVDYLLPTPIDSPLVVTARVSETAGRKTWLDVDAVSDGKAVARARVLAVRVPAEWTRPGVSR